jgi:hypothetical protein
MAHLTSQIEFVGPVGGLSFYKRRDSDKIIIRSKGGASKEKIKTSERFVRVRRNNMEFGARSSATRQIRRAIEPLKFIADYNFTGYLNSLLKPIQLLDTVSDKGKRNVYISRNPHLLEGFNLNRKSPFESMIINPVQYSLYKDSFSGFVEFPALLPGNNFILPQGNYPYYRFVMTIGFIPDMIYNPDFNKNYRAESKEQEYNPAQIKSDWFPVAVGSASTKLEVQLKPPQELPAHFSLMMAAGVCFGKIARDGSVEPVKYVGCAKILAMA